MKESPIKTRIPFDILAVAICFAGIGIWFIPELAKSQLHWIEILGGPLFAGHLISYRFKTFEVTDTQLVIATPFVPFLRRRIDLKGISLVWFRVVPPFYGIRRNEISILRGKGVKHLNYDFRASEEMTVNFIQRLESLGVSCSEKGRL